jgi:hypothetical protein
MPAAVKTASRAFVNFVSRSRTRKRNCWARSSRSMSRLRACWVTPSAGRMAGGAQDVDAAAGDLYHEEDVDALEEDGVDGEEIACEDTGCLGSEERAL